MKRFFDESHCEICTEESNEKGECEIVACAHYKTSPYRKSPCNVDDCFAFPGILSSCPFTDCDNCVHNLEGDREQCNYESMEDFRKRGEEEK